MKNLLKILLVFIGTFFLLVFAKQAEASYEYSTNVYIKKDVPIEYVVATINHNAEIISRDTNDYPNQAGGTPSLLCIQKDTPTLSYKLSQSFFNNINHSFSSTKQQNYARAP